MGNTKQDLGGNTRSCSIRAPLAEAMLMHFCAYFTHLIISPSSRSKKAAPSSDTRKCVNQQFRGKVHINILFL